ncbi:hypothetical protein [Streptomyces sp. NPDC059631]|uniref:hypothetical protein n=1 Tax=unclassified Streptomyces TaxID=2593676 RepID=UPI00369B0F07
MTALAAPAPPSTWSTLDSSGLALVLEKLLRWTSADVEALLDDIADVLDDVLPAGGEMEGCLRRLRAQLQGLVETAAAGTREGLTTTSGNTLSWSTFG